MMKFCRSARAFGAALFAATLLSSAPASAQTVAPPTWPAVGLPEAGLRTTGRWLWGDLVSTDVARSREFYGRVFGWTFEEIPGEGGQPGYVTILANGRPIGGMVAARNAAAGARWIGLVSGDPAALSARAAELGGSVVLAPRSLPGRGDFALLSDPQGARFGVLLTEKGDPADFTGALHEWMWTELWTPEPVAAVGFYKALFGYTVSPAAGKGVEGYTLSAGGRARAGVLRSPDPGLSAAWVPYVRVADVARTVALAREHGARVIVAPRRHHRYEVAVLVDPLGAPFAVAAGGAR